MSAFNFPLVSIVMPAYNAEKFVVEAIESILNQTYTNIELLISDDKSTDNTRKLIEQFSDPRVKFYHNDHNEGYLKTCNHLFLKCKGELITFQDADDFSEPDRIQEQVSVLNDDLSLYFCGTWYKRISVSGEVIEFVEKPTDYESILECLKTKNGFCGATLMFRREILTKIGGYREFFDRIGNEDYDWIFLVCEKYKGINISKYLYAYRYNFDSVSQEVSLQRYLSQEYVRHFGVQRKKYGEDYLQQGDSSALNKYVENVEAPYRKDRTLIFRNYANAHTSSNNFGKALRFVQLGIKANPLKPVNYYVMYVILKKYFLTINPFSVWYRKLNKKRN